MVGKIECDRADGGAKCMCSDFQKRAGSLSLGGETMEKLARYAQDEPALNTTQ